MKMGSSNDKEAVKAQYASSKGLDTRINFHNKYSTNKMGFSHWLTSNYEIKEGMKVLELGTGTGDMWKGKDDLISKCDKLVLSDFSEGMLDTAKKNVGERTNIEYRQIDVQNIPFEDGSFDIVIANMMLYHVPDIDKAVSEIGRVLKSDGVFYSATYGEHNFNDIIAEWFGLAGENYAPNHLFTLQNGSDILGKEFADIEVRRYEDSLHVTDLEDLADYLQSLKALHSIGTMKRDDIIKLLLPHAEGGAIDLQKEYGTFIARLQLRRTHRGCETEKDMEIKTKRLTLRPVRIGDEEEIHEYAGDKDLTMMFWLPNETFEETCDFVKRNAADWESPDQTDFEFVIVYNGKIIGGCDADLSHSEDRSYATLGWIINKQYRNMGFASEAGSALLDFAFENLNVEKVYAQCDTLNTASYNVMKKIGMTCVNDTGTRTYPKTGKTSGEYTCMITKEEWRDMNKR